MTFLWAFFFTKVYQHLYLEVPNYLQVMKQYLSSNEKTT